MICDAILIRYDEIALKGNNRLRFENQLVEDISRACGRTAPVSFVRERGRIVLRLRPRPDGDNDVRFLCARLETVFGLSSFSPGKIIDSELAAIEATVNELFPPLYAAATNAAPGQEQIRYRIRVRRNNKDFPLTSNAVEVYFADRLLPQYERLLVDLNRPDIDIGIEIRRNWSFVYWQRCDGQGGLPSGSSGTVLAMLSGGIDSPVACYLSMRRGCRVHFLTFHSYPYTATDNIVKVRRIVRHLNQFQAGGTLLSCNLAPCQKLIRDHCSQKFRTVLYRRMMLRVAAVIAQSTNSRAIITGDAIGQVASQTLTNMATIDQASDCLLLRPLATMDKREIVAMARTIGTYELSQGDCSDSCTVFAPRSPSTRAPLHRVIAEEERLDIPEIVTGLLASVRVINVETGADHAFTVRSSKSPTIENSRAPRAQRPRVTEAVVEV